MEIEKYLTFIFLFFLIILPIFYLIFSTFFPNFQLASLNTFSEIKFSIFFKSVAIAALTAFTATLIGLLTSIILEFTNAARKNFFRFFLFMPFLIPNYIFTFSWLGFLGKRGTFADFVFPNISINIYNPLSLILILTFSLFPISMFIISLGLKNVDRNMIDAARLSKKRLLMKVLIPLVKPHIIVSFFFVFSFAISEYTTPAFLRISTYQSELFVQLAAFFNVERAIIYSLPLILLTAFFSLSIYFYFKKISFTTITSFSRKKEEFINLSKKSKSFVYIFLLALLLFSLAIPLFMMVVEGGKEIFNVLVIAKLQLINSLVLSAAASLVITFLGVISYYLFRENLLLLTLFMLPLAISSPVIGISLINLYSKLPLPIYGTALMVVLGFIMRFLPFSIFIFSSFLPQVSFSLEEYSRVCKTGFFKKIYKIVLPLTKGGILSSFIIIFILCLGEVGVTQMVSPPDIQTLSMRIETMMHYGNYSYVAALSLVLLLFIFFFYLIYGKMYERENH